MAKSIIAARNTALASTIPAAEFSLRPLKNRLQARFPDVKSSHLSEAIAAGLGFNTNAALRAEQTGPSAWQLEYKTLDTSALHRRLVELKYPLQPDFSFGLPPPAPKPPAHYVAWLNKLRELDRTPKAHRGRVRALNALCADEFAKTFRLGHLEDREDKRVVVRWGAGVDHGMCLPGWGGKFNCRTGTYVDFPGTDYRRQFCQSLPLSNGKVAEYTSALVSMPYMDGNGMPRELDEAAHVAGRIGWTCQVLPEWTWYAPGSTTLVLFKRSTPHEAMLKAWERSFMRWLVENRTALNRAAGSTRKKVIVDTYHCQHVPLDLRDFEDCRQRYLKEFAPHMFHGRDEGMAGIFERLMESWAQQR